MRAYLISTGAIFALVALAHVWRVAAEIRRRASAAFEGSKRVRRDEASIRPVARTWPMTIADVYHGGEPNGAAKRVRRWARAIRSALG